jgi:hypothetical protein
MLSNSKVKINTKSSIINFFFLIPNINEPSPAMKPETQFGFKNPRVGVGVGVGEANLFLFYHME